MHVYSNRVLVDLPLMIDIVVPQLVHRTLGTITSKSQVESRWELVYSNEFCCCYPGIILCAYGDSIYVEREEEWLEGMLKDYWD